MQINNSLFVNDILKKYYSKEEVFSLTKNKIKLNWASILLPNLSNATFDDIFEFRTKAKDELIELRHYINSMTDKIDIENENSINDIMLNYINPSVKNLELKMKDLKINVIQKFLTEIKNPMSYSPLLTSFFTDVPMHLSLLISSGLISANTILEYKKQMNGIKRDNMYFLLKLRKF